MRRTHKTTPRSSGGRWSLLLLAAALVGYGIAGLPRPGDSGPSRAAAHPLPGFPHSHGGNPICRNWTCPPPSDGTNDRNSNNNNNNRNSNNRNPGNRPQRRSNCVGVHAAGCNQGVDQGYIDANDDLSAEIDDPDDISEMANVFADHPGNRNLDFDADDFTNTMRNADRPPNRGDVADALCAAISTCSGTGQRAIQYLLDNDVSFGQTDDTLEGFNPTNPVTIGQMGSFFNRLEEPDEGDQGNGGRGNNPGNRGNQGNGGNSPGNRGPEEDACATGLDLPAGRRSLFGSQLRWETLVGIEADGEPGRPWPPHPDVPGGTEYLVVSGSPVWPVIESDASWQVAGDDGCGWEAVSVQTRLAQLMPWRPDDRAAIENADSARPGAVFDTYLDRWDNLSAAQQAQARQYHTNRDVSASCGIETATISADSYARCRWELPAPGVWSWQASACFEGVAEDVTFRECATLASGVEWFLQIIDYTSGITLQDSSGTTPRRESRRPVLAG